MTLINPKKIAVVGGLPEPIGGITTFIKRLIKKEKCVHWLFDLYPSKSKSVPKEFLGNYICHKQKTITLVRLFFFVSLGVLIIFTSIFQGLVL